MGTNHEADEQLTQERLALTAIEQKINQYIITPLIPGKANATLAMRSAQLASMWLGKAKGALGIKSPYPASFDPKSSVIEDRADYQEVDEPIGEFDPIAHVKALRAELKNMEKAIHNDRSIMKINEDYQLCVTNAYTRCSEATLWLGMVLNDIKIDQEAPKSDSNLEASIPTTGNKSAKTSKTKKEKGE